MDNRPDTEVPDVVPAQTPGHRARSIEETSVEYLTHWNRLQSTTNWEKGRIICQWREALMAAGTAPECYSDLAWSRLAGGVTPQHTGRLRRVYQRFGTVYRQYQGLYWSHFLAACEWSDAEMWLEGAVQNGWSVGHMRLKRWDAIGAPPDRRPRDQDVIATEPEEELPAADQQAAPEVIAGALGVVQQPQPVARHQAQAPPHEPADADAPRPSRTPSGPPTIEPFRPFQELAPLPPDLSRAFQAFQRAIRRHQRSGWRKISLGDVLIVLDALRQLALAPAEDPSGHPPTQSESLRD